MDVYVHNINLLSPCNIYSKLTFCHSNDASIGTHHEHTEVWSMPSHAKNGGLEVLFMASKVDESDDLWRRSTDVQPV